MSKKDSTAILMSIDTAQAQGAVDGAREAAGATRVLVVFEQGRAGAAALREAAELAVSGAELHVVTLAPQARPSRCCGPGPGPYNCAVREGAEEELHDARENLGSTAQRATFTTLVGCPDPPLAAWAAEHAFDLILLPAHRLTRGGNRLANSLRRATAADVRLVR